MKLGLTTVQLKSLLYIEETGDANSKMLAEALEVTPANVTGVIDRLIERGLVQRMENPADRRITLLRVTEKGKELITNLEEYAAEHMTTLLATLSEEELDHLYKGLAAFITASEKRFLRNNG